MSGIRTCNWWNNRIMHSKLQVKPFKSSGTKQHPYARKIVIKLAIIIRIAYYMYSIMCHFQNTYKLSERAWAILAGCLALNKITSSTALSVTIWMHSKITLKWLSEWEKTNMKWMHKTLRLRNPQTWRHGLGGMALFELMMEGFPLGLET